VVGTLRGRRAIVAKLGMDAHWRGAMVVARSLRDAGMEVIYLGHATAAEIAAIAVQEDADLVGLSSLSGNHLGETASVLGALKAVQAGDIPVVVGGSISDGDARRLLEAGVAAVFPSGSSLESILAAVTALLAAPAGAGRVREGGRS